MLLLDPKPSLEGKVKDIRLEPVPSPRGGGSLEAGPLLWRHKAPAVSQTSAQLRSSSAARPSVLPATCLIGLFILSTHKHAWSTSCILPTAQVQLHRHMEGRALWSNP